MVERDGLLVLSDMHTAARVSRHRNMLTDRS
jgi:hypothetical protein